MRHVIEQLVPLLQAQQGGKKIDGDRILKAIRKVDALLNEHYRDNKDPHQTASKIINELIEVRKAGISKEIFEKISNSYQESGVCRDGDRVLALVKSRLLY